MTFVIGYFYKKRYMKGEWAAEKKRLHIVVITTAILLIAVRAYLESVDFIGIMDKAKDLAIQYTKLFWAFAIFILFERLIPSESWDAVGSTIKRRLFLVSSMTYDIYSAHQFYVSDTFTNLFPFHAVIQFIIALLFMFTTGWMLWRVSKYIKI